MFEVQLTEFLSLKTDFKSIVQLHYVEHVRTLFTNLL